MDVLRGKRGKALACKECGYTTEPRVSGAMWLLLSLLYSLAFGSFVLFIFNPLLFYVSLIAVIGVAAVHHWLLVRSISRTSGS